MWFATRDHRPSAAQLLPLWDVRGSAVVDTRGCVFEVRRLHGLDSEHLASSVLEQAASQLYRGLAEELSDETLLQVVVESRDAAAEVVDRLSALPAPSNPLLGLQRARRLDFLAAQPLRRFDGWIAVGALRPMTRRLLARPDRWLEPRLEEASGLAAKVVDLLARGGVPVTQVHVWALLSLISRGLGGPADLDRPARSESAAALDAIADTPALRTLSLREHLAAALGPVRWSDDAVEVDGRHHAVLTLRTLPPATWFTLPERVLHLPFEFRLSVNVRFPHQAAIQRRFRQARRFAHADAHRERYVQDDRRRARMSELDRLSALLAETGQKLVCVGAQLVLSADTAAALARQVRYARDFLRRDGLLFCEETSAHDRELAKSIPGLAGGFTRWRLCTSNNAVDLLPVFGGKPGDANAALVLETARGEPFGFNPVARERDNWNACVFGASGAGKSVLMNLLISTSMLAGPGAGRVMVVDHAGASRSSYLWLTTLVGGAFVPVLDAAHAGGLNPFPALGPDETVPSHELTTLCVLTDVLLANTGSDKDAALHRATLQRAIAETYRQANGRPGYPDLLVALERAADSGPDAPRARVLATLLRAFLDSPHARLFAGDDATDPNAADAMAPLVVFDLFGLDRLPDHIAQAVAFVVTQRVKALAFDRHDDAPRYVVLDEVAQLIRTPELAALTDELYATARKHRTSVWTVTQQYASYTGTPLAGTVRLNSSTQLILSHASDAGARDLLARDFDLDPRERAILDDLRTVKGRYAEALLRSRHRHPATGAVEPGATRLRIKLSPFDYQIATSDPEDRARQRRWLDRNSDVDPAVVLDRLAATRSRR